MTEPGPLLRPDEAYHAQAIPLKRDRISPLPLVQRNITTVAVLSVSHSTVAHGMVVERRSATCPPL
jgi:hypothetical protein